MIFHCREAHADMIQTISTFAKASADKSSEPNNSRSDPPKSRLNRDEEGHRENKLDQIYSPGVFHCYGGSIRHLKLLLTMGYYIGYDGNITYSSDWQKFVSATPLDRLLLETDAPYLTPEPHRGTRNEPSFLPLVAQTVANYQQKPITEVIHLSTKNTLQLFTRLRD